MKSKNIIDVINKLLPVDEKVEAEVDKHFSKPIHGTKVTKRSSELKK